MTIVEEGETLMIEEMITDTTEMTGNLNMFTAWIELWFLYNVGWPSTCVLRLIIKGGVLISGVVLYTFSN